MLSKFKKLKWLFLRYQEDVPVFKILFSYQKSFFIIFFLSLCVLSGGLFVFHFQEINSKKVNAIHKGQENLNTLLKEVEAYLTFTQKRFEETSFDDKYQPNLGSVLNMPANLSLDAILYLKGKKYTNQGFAPYTDADDEVHKHIIDQNSNFGIFQDRYHNFYFWKKENKSALIALVKVSAVSLSNFLAIQEPLRIETDNPNTNDRSALALLPTTKLTFYDTPVDIGRSFFEAYRSYFILAALVPVVVSLTLVIIYGLILRRIKSETLMKLKNQRTEIYNLKKFLEKHKVERDSLSIKQAFIKSRSMKIYSNQNRQVERVAHLVEAMLKSFTIFKNSEKLDMKEFLFSLKSLIHFLPWGQEQGMQESFDLSETIENILSAFQYEIKEKKLLFKKNLIIEDNSNTQILKRQFEVLLFNLLGKLLDRAKEEGYIHIETVFDGEFSLLFKDNGYKIPLKEIEAKKEDYYNPYFDLSWIELEKLMDLMKIEIEETLGSQAGNELRLHFKTQIKNQDAKVIPLFS